MSIIEAGVNNNAATSSTTQAVAAAAPGNFNAAGAAVGAGGTVSDETTPPTSLNIKINELKQQYQQSSQFEITGITRPEVLASSSSSTTTTVTNSTIIQPNQQQQNGINSSSASNINLTNISIKGKERSRFKIIKTDSESKVNNAAAKQQSSFNADQNSIRSNSTTSSYALSGSVQNANFNNSNTVSLMNSSQNGNAEQINQQRQQNALNCTQSYQRGRWYVADFELQQQQQQQQYQNQHQSAIMSNDLLLTNSSQNNNMEQHHHHHHHHHHHQNGHASLNNGLNGFKTMTPSSLHQTQTHFNPIESTNGTAAGGGQVNNSNQQQSMVHSSINNAQSIIQPTPTFNKNNSTSINDNNINIPQQLQQNLISNSSNSLSSNQHQQHQQMPIAVQPSMLQNNSANILADVHSSIMSQSQKHLLHQLTAQDSFESNQSGNNTDESIHNMNNNGENPVSVFQHEIVLSGPTNSNLNTNTITTTSTTITTLTQQNDSNSSAANLNSYSNNSNLSPIVSQISPQDNQQQQQQQQTVTTTTQQFNNNPNNILSNTSVQASPTNVGALGLTSVQSNSILTTSMSTIASLDHGVGTSAQLSSTSGPGSINDLINNVDDLNIVTEQRSSSDSGIHSRIELAMDLVKSHLTLAVKEEIVALKNQIKQLDEVCTRLEMENQIFRQHATPETLLLIENVNRAPNSTSSNINNNNNNNSNINNTISNTTTANTSNSNCSNMSNASNNQSGSGDSAVISSGGNSTMNVQLNNNNNNNNSLPVNQDSMISSFTEHVLNNNGDILTSIPNNNNNNNNNNNTNGFVQQ